MVPGQGQGPIPYYTTVPSGPLHTGTTQQHPSASPSQDRTTRIICVDFQQVLQYKVPVRAMQMRDLPSFGLGSTSRGEKEASCMQNYPQSSVRRLRSSVAESPAPNFSIEWFARIAIRGPRQNGGLAVSFKSLPPTREDLVEHRTTLTPFGCFCTCACVCLPGKEKEKAGEKQKERPARVGEACRI